MIKIEPDVLYERAELAEAFPWLSQSSLTRTLLAWGGRRPYPGSRKIFIRGDAILKATKPNDSEPEAPPIETPPRRDKQATVKRMKAW
jgi:hypothetical protein